MKRQGNREMAAPPPRSQGITCPGVERSSVVTIPERSAETFFPPGFGSGSFICGPEYCFIEMTSLSPRAEGKSLACHLHAPGSALGFGLAFGLTRNSAQLAVAGAPRAQLYYCLFHPSGKVPAHASSSAVSFQLLQRDSVLAGGQVAVEGSPQILLSVTLPFCGGGMEAPLSP